MKGIILAAGRGTRLYPMTKPVCKPLLPVYDKPLLYYPLSVLMQAGIDQVLVIVPPGETGTFSALLGDGAQLGISIQYTVQPVARGIADALLIGGDFLAGEDVCLVLGDNLDLDKISASYRDGVLQLRIPVAERAKPRKISIDVTTDADRTIEGSSQGSMTSHSDQAAVGS